METSSHSHFPLSSKRRMVSTPAPQAFSPPVVCLFKKCLSNKGDNLCVPQDLSFPVFNFLPAVLLCAALCANVLLIDSWMAASTTRPVTELENCRRSLTVPVCETLSV